MLQSCDINNYLAENVSYDQGTSDKIRNELVQSVPISSGVVQAGERIVDRGEIIDSHTYNVLLSLKTVYESQSGGTQRHSLMLAGQIILVCGLLFCYWLYLWSFRLKILHNRRNTFFLLCCIFSAVLITEFCVTYNLFSIYILPYAIIPIVVRTFFDSRTALFTHLITVLMCSVMAPFPHEFLILQIIAGMVVTFSLKELSQRSQLMHCALFVFLSYALSYLSLVLYQDADLNKIHWVMMLYFGINFILLMFTYVLVYMLEKMFGYLSTITLVELSNINSGILKRLSETCPGTFQHSLQVSIIASEAAAKIGANAQLVRTGAMYHDVGKMSNPLYFTENQNGNLNPHNDLSYIESAQRVISHVTEGVKIAEKAGLPKEIIDFIRTHHGRGKAKYFYNSYKNQYPDKPVDESLFMYPGPNPFSKETAIVMMADSVEAASRSLKEHTEEGIKQLVNKITSQELELTGLNNRFVQNCNHLPAQIINQLARGCPLPDQINVKVNIATGRNTEIIGSGHLKLLVQLLQQQVFAGHFKAQLLGFGVHTQNCINFAAAKTKRKRVNLEHTIVKFGRQVHIICLHSGINNQSTDSQFNICINQI